MNIMKHIILIISLLLLPVTLEAQQHRGGKKAVATQQAAKGKQAKAQQGKSQQKTQPKGQQKTHQKGKGKKNGKQKGKSQTYTTAEIQGLQSQRNKIQQEIKNQQGKLQANQADVKKRLEHLMVLNSEIDEKQKDIDTYENDIKHLDGNISLLQAQVKSLSQQLEERKQKYVNSMRYMARHRTIQDKLMFVFSSKSLSQAARRLRFVREYAKYQRLQGEQIRQKQEELGVKNQQLQTARSNKNSLLSKGKQAHRDLQTKQNEQQQAVEGLRREQKSIQAVINEQQQKNVKINAEIDRLVAIEVEKARKRAEAEAKAAAEARRKAEAEAKRKREEQARQKAEAERQRREEARRIAEAKAREARLKAEAEARAREAREAQRRAEAERKRLAEAEARAREREERAEAQRLAAQRLAAEQEEARQKAEVERARQEAREAEAARQAAERKAFADEQRRQREMAAEEKEAEAPVSMVSTVDRKMSGSFESNKGRLPMPASGRIVSHFGQYNVEGLTNVKLDNKGINILCQPGAAVRSIFDGEVSAVVNIAGQMVVMVRHGSYISVYCNLKSVSVRKGQNVSTRQTIGTVGQDNILQFQLRKETAKLNPEQWLGR